MSHVNVAEVKAQLELALKNDWLGFWVSGMIFALVVGLLPGFDRDGWSGSEVVGFIFLVAVGIALFVLGISSQCELENTMNRLLAEIERHQAGGVPPTSATAAEGVPSQNPSAS